jgi:phytoene synthase
VSAHPISTSDPVATLVRSEDFDRYAATLFAPARARPHLLALYAFDIEIGRVRDLVSEPMPGELRLQWWRDALEDPERADAVSHPVARALEGAIAYGRLPRGTLLDVIDARTDDLYDDPVPSLSELEGRLGATHSRVLRLASLIAAGGDDPGGAEAAGFGGVAQGLARLMGRLPRDLARGRVLLPVDRMASHGVDRERLLSGVATEGGRALLSELVDHADRRLVEAREAFEALAPAAAPAFLALAGVEPALERLRAARDPLRPASEIAPWRRLLRLWRMSRRTPPF